MTNFENCMYQLNAINSMLLKVAENLMDCKIAVKEDKFICRLCKAPITPREVVENAGDCDFCHLQISEKELNNGR